MSDDLDLLEQYEPILRFTHGEMFYPTSAAGYVSQCSLWMHRPNHAPELLAEAGSLTLERLATLGKTYPGQYLYLRYVQQPLTPREYDRWSLRPDREQFRAPGRLARVGLVARLIDALFSLSIFLRGTVPGGTAAAAAIQYARLRDLAPGFYYYGRVVREADYIVLHYLFFYAMNDWRSSFYGANDHEADWEQVLVYLDATDGQPPVPVWVAYANHDYAGDALRRRWDDPELTRCGNHPVVFVAAGSHAAYFQAGEYVTRVEIGFLRPVLRIVQTLERIWRDTLRQGETRDLTQRVQSLLSVPFVEYVRGDGPAVGPRQPVGWTRVPISGADEWVDQYRGLWGLDTRDPFPGERAPAGPKYNVSGTMRRTWHDPLGWAGLDKVAPPRAAKRVLSRHLDNLDAERIAIEGQITSQRGVARRVDLEVQALRNENYSPGLLRERRQVLRNEEAELRKLERHHARLVVTVDAVKQQIERVDAGNPGDPRDHLPGLYVPVPETERDLRQRRIAEIWSAVSVGALLLAFVVLVLTPFAGGIIAIALSIGLFVVIEASFHRRLRRLLVNVTILLAVLTSGVLIYEFFVEITLLAIIALALLIITDNIRELRGP